MRVLLDTHAFLWAITGDSRLSPLAQRLFLDSRNVLLLSAASIWEIAIKVRIGKLPLPQPSARYLGEQLSRNAIEVLPVEASHALRLFELPDIHRDPFDRLLVAQCQVEGLPLVTGDAHLRQYAVETLW
jgi:PIN domain nuclease of toxin-antitoxin system